MTIKEIAQLANVSRGTVDRVIHNRGKVNPEIQARILNIIKETDFSPNLAAMALKKSAAGLRIGVLLPSVANEFYLEVRQGIQRATEKYAQYGVTVKLIQLEELSCEAQCAAIDSLLTEGIDGLVLTAIDTPEMADYVSELSQDIPVITYNTDFSQSNRLCFVGQDHLCAGQTAGRLLCNSLRRPGKIVPLISYPTIRAHTKRVEGLCSVVPNSPVDVTVTEYLQTQERDDIAYALVRALLAQEGNDIAGIYVAGGGQVGAANALADSGRADEIMMVCYDLLPKTIEHLKAGVVNYTIGQQPFLQGYLPIRLLHEYLALGHKPDREFYYTSIDVRLRENADFNGINAFTGAI